MPHQIMAAGVPFTLCFDYVQPITQHITNEEQHERHLCNYCNSKLQKNLSQTSEETTPCKNKKKKWDTK